MACRNFPSGPTGDQTAAIIPGDSIRLRFSGFDFRTRGEVRGKITRVSAAPASQTLGDASGFGKEPTPYRYGATATARSM